MINLSADLLDLPKGQFPPTPCELLGVAEDERDLNVLEEAALRRMTLVRAWQHTHPEESTRLQNEIAWALGTLSDLARHVAAVAEKIGLTVLALCQEGTTQPTLWQVRLQPMPMSERQHGLLAKQLRGRQGRGAARARILHRGSDGRTNHTELVVAFGPCQAADR